MSEPLIIEEGPMPPELAVRFEKARRNLLWFNEHVRELEVYERYRGRYVAAASEELFVADTPEELRRLMLIRLFQQSTICSAAAIYFSTICWPCAETTV